MKILKDVLKTVLSKKKDSIVKKKNTVPSKIINIKHNKNQRLKRFLN